MPFRVALVGRTNVGKSSLFNRILKRRTAIVSPKPGVTLDRIENTLELGGKRVLFTDTGGIPSREDHFTPHLLNQWHKAIDEAHLVLFMVDAKEGLTPLDQEVASILRKKGKRVVLVINKVDNPQREEEAILEFSPLAVEECVVTSVVHGRGIRHLLEIIEDLAPEEDAEEQDPMATLAILGRPNVGKSSLVNLLAGEERVVVTEIPGTTRDAVDVLVEWEGNRVLLVDTAGLRRKSRVDGPIEAYSITRSVEAIKRASVCLLMLDASEGPTEQDQKIASVVIRNYRPLVVALNKWDLVSKEDRGMVLADTLRMFRFIPDLPLHFTSTVTRKGIKRIMEELLELNRLYHTRIQTSKVNQALEELVRRHQPPVQATGRRSKPLYATQVDVAPPHIVLFAGEGFYVPQSYLRYLAAGFQELLGLKNVPIKLSIRRKK